MPASPGTMTTISASTISALVDRTTDTCVQPILVKHVIVCGDLDLSRAEFRKHVVFEDCEFQGHVDFSFSTFNHGLSLEQCKFSSVNLARAVVEQELKSDSAEYLSLDASGLRVNGHFHANSTQYGKAKFDFLHVGQTCFLHAAQFSGEARFDMACIEGGLEFAEEDGASATIRTWFGGDARFISVTVKGYALFNDAQFDGIVNFDGIIIEGDAFFERCDFAVQPSGSSQNFVSFVGARFKAQCVFDGAKFSGIVRFDQAQFGGDPLFAGVKFSGDAKFLGAAFSAPLRFDTRNTNLGAAQFNGRSDFIGVTGGDLRLDGVHFNGSVSFRDATFKKIFLQSPRSAATIHECSFPVEHQGSVELSGLTYDHLSYSDAHLDVFRRIEPFDLQPYRQAERILRAMGSDRDADRVYLIRRRRTLNRNLQEKHYFRYAGNLLYSTINFGVGWKMLTLIPLLLMVGVATLIFQQPGALHGSVEKDCAALRETIPPLASAVSYFLPIELPATSCTVASENLIRFPLLGFWLRAITWATVLKIAGWIFVPLWVAAITGLLHRDPGK